MSEQVVAQLSEFGARSYASGHDDMRYFTEHFGLTRAASVLDGAAAPAGAARTRKVVEAIAANNVGCMLTEDGHPSRLAEQLAADAKLPVLEYTPRGLDGQSYPDMLAALGNTLAACLGPKG